MLRTYDIVAARPVNQAAFDQACKVSEVDIIAMDFSQKLPFRLKLPLIEAATKRGIQFEITYSHLIGDVNIRRQMLSDAKLLVDWTRGKNLIVSSAASTVNEIRGPYDVANLSAFLLGLPAEKARAAISGNCRLLIANTLRKKHCYKEAIRIERILPNEELNPERACFGDWKDWDPISSGEGDIPPLDDIANFFPAACEGPKSSIVSDLMSDSDRTQSKGQISGEDEQVSKNPVTSTFSFPEEPVLPVHDVVPFSMNDFIQHDRLIELQVKGRISANVASIEQQTSHSECNLVLSNDVVTIAADAEEHVLPISGNEDQRNADLLSIVSDKTEMLLDDTTPKNCIVIGEDNLIAADATLRSVVESIEPSSMSMEDHKCSDEATCVPSVTAISEDTSSLMDCIPSVSGYQTVMNDNGNVFLVSEEKGTPEEQVVGGPNEKENASLVSSFNPTLLQGCALINSTRSVLSLCSEMTLDDTSDEIKEPGQHEFVLVGTSDFLGKGVFNTEEQKQNFGTADDDIIPHKIESGKGRHKERLLYPVYPLPFKGILKPTPFKRKLWQLRRPSKHL